MKTLLARDLQTALSNRRRDMASRSPLAFAHVYLPHHVRCEGSRMHHELYSLLERATRERAQRIAVAAPRGHAKSTIVSLAYVLWSALYRHEPFILLIGATSEQAEQHLRSIREELQSNPRLLEDFPDVCGISGKPWRKNLLNMPNEVLIRALGAGQGVRGTKHRQDRPSLIVIDDLETQEGCIEIEQRHKLRDWFTRTLLKAGDERTNVIVAGTIVHYDSLLANLTSSKPGGFFSGWTRRLYQAVESFSAHPELWGQWEAIRRGDAEYEGATGSDASMVFYGAHQAAMLKETRVLWPARESYLQLMQMRTDEGHASFQAEKQNEPLDPDTCLFHERNMRYWNKDFDSPEELLRALGPDLYIVAACDPSMGRRHGRGDYTAIVIVVKNLKSGHVYVLEADIARRSPQETIERIIALARAYDICLFYFEANQFQEVMSDQLTQRLRAAGLMLTVETVNNTTHKGTRIQALEPMVSSGKLIFSRQHTLLIDQLRQYPLGAHDDGPDALEMAVSGAVRPIGGVSFIPVYF